MRESGSRDAERLAWEASVGWDHPLVIAGFWPGHLLRDSFHYTRSGFRAWAASHQYLTVTINGRPWFPRDRFLAWANDPANAHDLPPVEPATGTTAREARTGMGHRRGRSASR